MKKRYTLFVLALLAVLPGNAQTYYPMLDSTNEWTYTVQTLGVSPSSFSAAPCTYPYVSWNVFRHYTTGDTIIDSLSYKIVMNSDQPCEVGYLREDTAAQQVFFIDNNGSPEVLLYDFSMQVGDSIPLNFYGGQYQPGMYTLDSITTYNIGAGPRRAFHLNCHSLPWSWTVTWVESVGQLNDVIYPYFNNMPSSGYFANCPGLQHQFEQFMICFSHDSRIFLDSCSHAIAASMPIQTYYVDSCNYSSFLGSAGDITAPFTMDFSPNPSGDQGVLRLELKNAETMTLFLYDVTGKETFLRRALGNVPPGKSDIAVDLSGLPDGFYLAEVRTPNGSVYSKLVVKH